MKNARYSAGLCPPDPTVASAQTATNPAESAMLEARNPGVTHSSGGDRLASLLTSTCPARNSSESASTHLTIPIAISDGCGPGTALAATSGDVPTIPTSKVKLLEMRWPSSALTEVQSTVYTPEALVAIGMRIS